MGVAVTHRLHLPAWESPAPVQELTLQIIEASPDTE